MSSELEAAAAASADGFFRRLPEHHAAAVGTPCANCATKLNGPWCHVCGQSAEDFHRSILRLLGEVVEGLLHMDGRLWRTVPDLLLRPGRLTRSYLEGHRAPQIPPLRLFLVVLLGIFLIGGLTGGHGTKLVTITETGDAKAKMLAARTRNFDQMSPQERAKAIDQIQVSLGSNKPNEAATQWLRERVQHTMAEPERFKLVLEQWSERFAFLMLPISALMLSALFMFRREFFMFDHTIFSLHSLSAVGTILIAGQILEPAIGDAAFLPLLGAPVHLYAHMRGVYRTGVVGTLVRMALLFVATGIAAMALIFGLVAVGLAGMG